MNRPRIMFITPPYHSGVVESAGTWLPLHYVYLAGAARSAGAEVRIYDAMSMNHSHDDIVREVEAWKPDIVGVTAITAMEPDARQLCANVKKISPRILTIMGNTHPTYMWDDILRNDANVDLIVCGEGEDTMADIVRAVATGDDLRKIPGVALRQNGHPARTKPRPFLQNLDLLSPAWDLVDWPMYSYRPVPDGRLAIMSTSRGCVAACSFCSQQLFWDRKWRARDPLSLVNEVEHLRRNYDLRVAMFSDETPTTDRKRWIKVLDLLIERDLGVEFLMETRVVDILRDEPILDKYAKAGISHIYVGVEATRQESLDLYKKDISVAQGKKAIDLINQYGMVSETSFVLGTPDETQETIDRTVELAKHYNPDMAFFLAITPWPYAEIYPELKEYVETDDYRKYNLTEAVVKPVEMTTDEMTAALGDAAHEFFAWKFQNLEKLSEHKRQFMVRVASILMNHSYLAEDMASMREKMPAWVRDLLEIVEAEEKAMEANGILPQPKKVVNGPVTGGCPVPH